MWPLRVCFLTSTYPAHQGSPVGGFVERLAILLSERGHEITVVTPRIFSTSSERESLSGVRVVRFPYRLPGRQLVSFRCPPLLTVGDYVARGTLGAVRLARETRCHLIHAHWVVPTGLMGALAARGVHKPLVVSAHGTDLLTWARKPGARGLVRWTLSRANACSANSAYMTDECRHLGVPRERLSTIYETGVDVSRFHPGNQGSEVRRAYGVRETDTLGLCVGNLTRVKGVDVLLEAFAQVHRRVPTLRLLLVGDGTERPALEGLAAGAGVAQRVVFAGAKPWHDLPPYFAAADFLVLPSRQEGMGIVLLEGMATGKALLGTSAGGIPTLIQPEENGLLVPPEDPAAMGEGLVRLCRDGELRRRLGARGRRLACERYSQDRQVDAVEELYRRALGSPPGSAATAGRAV